MRISLYKNGERHDIANKAEMYLFLREYRAKHNQPKPIVATPMHEMIDELLAEGFKLYDDRRRFFK